MLNVNCSARHNQSLRVDAEHIKVLAKLLLDYFKFILNSFLFADDSVKGLGLEAVTVY